MKKQVWPATLISMKQQQEKIAVVTAYDYLSAKIVEEAGVPVILVGDSLGNVVAGFESTLGVTMEQMLYHVQIVARAAEHSLVVADMPYLSYHVDPKEAVKNAGRLIQQGRAKAVKLEGGREALAEVLPLMRKAQIPVMGHLGLTPQSVNIFGGHKVQGRDEASYNKIVQDALFLEQEGCFAVVIEGVPGPLAKEMTNQLRIPTIGIGAGSGVDGQVLVLHDLLGFFEKPPKFVRKYENFKERMLRAVEHYVEDVKTSKFPSEEETYK